MYKHPAFLHLHRADYSLPSPLDGTEWALIAVFGVITLAAAIAVIVDYYRTRK